VSIIASFKISDLQPFPVCIS